jgi:hypothetical protein
MGGSGGRDRIANLGVMKTKPASHQIHAKQKSIKQWIAVGKDASVFLYSI